MPEVARLVVLRRGSWEGRERALDISFQDRRSLLAWIAR